MNRKIILTAIFLLLAAGTISAQVTFGSSTPVEGVTDWTDTATYTTSITAAVGATVAPPAQRSVGRTKSCRVLAIDHRGRMDSVEVTYSSASNPVVIGRSYVVTPSSVSYSGGGTPPTAETAFVRGDNASFGQFRALDRIFGGKTFTAGQSFSPNRNDAEELLNVANGTRLRAITLTLRSVGSGVARFDISMSVESDPKEKKKGTAASGNMTMSLDGTLDVSVADARPVLLDVAGNISASTKNKKNGATAGTATGTTSINIAYAF